MGNEIKPPVLPVEKVLGHLANERANREPLPGPLAEAFGSDGITVGKFVVRPVVAYDLVALKKLDSPLYRQMLEFQKPEAEEIPFTEEEGFELCYQFTIQANEVRRALNRGREYFREQAYSAIADNLQPAEINEILKAVCVQIRRMFETAIKYSGEEKKDGEVFTAPGPARETA